MKKDLPRLAPAGVNQKVIALIENLQAHLERPVRGSGYVHRIRVNIKRLRSWIRLIRNEEDANDLRDIDRELRHIMKKLSTRRDQQVLMENLKWLEKKADRDARLSSLNVIRSNLEKGNVRVPVDWVNVKTALLHVLDTLKKHTQKFNSIHLVRDGLQRTYKRAAKAGDNAFSGKIKPTDVHEFRKWAKYLFYQLEVLQVAYPELHKEALTDLEDVSNRLGRYHDLLLVRRRLGEVSAKKKYADAAKRTDDLIDMLMYKLLRRAQRQYRKIFSVSSSRFVMNLP